MVGNSSKKQLIEKLREAQEQSELYRNELSAFLKAARIILTERSFTETARSVFDLCRNLIGASSGYVALMDKTGQENEVLFLESGGLPCDVDPELPMPIRGLRNIAYQKKAAVYHNDFMESEWVGFMPQGHVILKNVMFAPLIINEKAVGVIGLANKEEDFNEHDRKVAAGFGELAAIALQNSKLQDEKNRADHHREESIRELKTALSQVKKLSGLLPICATCKKIRDDHGYWNQIESYIRDHSEVDFSHSLCPECARELYPGTGSTD